MKVTIGVWDCTFFLTDSDDNYVLDKDGNVQIYHAPDKDWSHIAEDVELEDLSINEFELVDRFTTGNIKENEEVK